MSKIYNVDYFFPEEILYNLSKVSQKPVMYIDAVGPKNCKDPERLAEVWDFYIDKCDNTILCGLMQRKELYCYFETESQALEYFNDWFPQKSALSDEEMDFYFYVRVVNVSSGLDIVNGYEKEV